MPKKVPRQFGCPYREFDPARGDRITRAMRERGFNYNCQLCYDINVSESTLSRWRKGSPISLMHAVVLSKSLGLTLDFLLTGSNQSGKSATFGNQVAEFCGIYSRLNAQNRTLFLNLLQSLLSRSTATSGPSLATLGNGEERQLPERPRKGDFDASDIPSEAMAPNNIQLELSWHHEERDR